MSHSEHDPPEVRGPRTPVTHPTRLGALPEGGDIFFAAIQTTRMPMIITDPRRGDNPIVFANKAFLQMSGYELGEVMGTNCRFLQGPDSDPEVVRALREAIAARRDISVELLNYRKDGSAFWNALFISPVYDETGELLYFFASQLDVSRRRDAEERMRQAQKMEAVGQLTGGIAHDFNNLLQVVLGYADILREALGDAPPPRVARAVSRIEEASRRGATLTQQLLAFARKQRLESRSVNLNQLVVRLAGMAGQLLGETVRIETRLAEGLWACRLDPTQAETALLNVLINARDAMPDGGVITIATANREVAAGDEAVRGEIRPGRHVLLEVTDTGGGMPPEVLARVMEPFFTTKEEGKGTGLGLSMVFGFTEQSGGSVRLRSAPGRGTTVSLLFPAPEQALPRPEPAGQTPAASAPRARGESVLVVEDRAEVGEVARLMLEDAGYRVRIVPNGREALAEMAGMARLDLLFTDFVMPGGMNGVALAREARRLRPELRVLLTTGYAEESLERRSLDEAGFAVLGKPYGREQLLRRVREALDVPEREG